MPEGVCHICGKFGPLTFEHVPPRAAFNNRRVVEVNFDIAIKLGPDEIAKGSIQQKGMGGYTLCQSCNNLTGHWYGKKFVDWCYQGMDILIRANGRPTLFYMRYLFPLAVIKQIITLFFSVNNAQFRVTNPELVRFVLRRDAMYLSPKYRVFVYYNAEGIFRAAGLSAIWTGHTGCVHVVSEITYPPFGYLLTLGSEPPDSRLFDITRFSRYSYDDFRAMELRMPVLPTYLMYPADYRTKKEIIEQRANKSTIRALTNQRKC